VVLRLVLSPTHGGTDALATFPPGRADGPRCAPPLLAQGDQVFDALIAVHPNSVPHGMASTPDGDTLYVAEGGAVAFLDAVLHEIKIERVSSMGVMAVRMELDPQAAQPGSNLLHIAGGRFGYWVMDATVSGTGNRAARIDDADGSADSRRWCNDVGFIRVGSTIYVAVTFAEKAESKLRLYRIDDVRAVFNDFPGDETGHEVTPAVEVALHSHPDWQPPSSQAFAFGLDVDEGADDVYVALGTHGVVRVHFDSMLAPTVTGGPVFGTGSRYALGDPELYDNFKYIKGGVVHREDPPFFVDVVVQLRGSGAHFLYCAVDHLGWVRFDLDGAPAWGFEMPIDHHEGTEIVNAEGEHQVKLRDSDGPAKMRTYARGLDFVDSPNGPVLAVASHDLPMIMEPAVLTEGRALSYDGNSFAGTGGVHPDLDGRWAYTFVYDLSQPLVHLEPNWVGSSHSGGDRVHLPPDQPGADPGDVDEIVVFTGPVAAGLFEPVPYDDPPPTDEGDHATVRLEFDWPDPPGMLPQVPKLVRTELDRPGRLCKDVGYSLDNPAVLQPSSNDAGFPMNGNLLECGDQIHSIATARPTQHGIIFNTGAQWLGGAREYVFSTGRAPGQSAADWKWSEFEGMSDLCPFMPPAPPELRKEVFFFERMDRWDTPGRQYFEETELDVDYDAAVQALPGHEGWEILVLTMVDSPDAYVYRRDILHANASDPGTPDQSIQDPDADPAAWLLTLDTHPEFVNVPTKNSNPPVTNFLADNGITGVGSYNAELFPLSCPHVPSHGDHWMVGIPSTTVRFDPNLNVDQSWFPDPDPWLYNFDHLLVRLFDLTDPLSPGSSYSIIGPKTQSSSLRLRAVELPGDEHYGFVVDFGGELLVYDLSSLLNQPDGFVLQTAFERYTPKLSLTDDLPCNVYGLAVDQAPNGEVYVYLGVIRVGIQPLRFEPTNPPGQRLVELPLIQTPGESLGLHIRDTGGTRTLLVGDTLAGVRVYGYGQ